jgi:hypothetical protein
MTANAESLNRLGNDLADEQRWHDAEQAYKRAADAAPEWSVPWYNLGLLYKRQRRWQESLDANQKALALDPEDGDSWWNLGIAATAAGDWQLARHAWRGCGIPLPDGDGPPELDYGLVPIRLNPESDAEVVWSRRIDPARAIIRNVPFPRSGYCEGDIVLHDGAPNGYRMRDDEKVPVFDVLQRLVPSPRTTFEATIEAASATDVDDLITMADSIGVAVEDWESVQNLCKACSEGLPHVHEESGVHEWLPRRRLGISAASLDAVLQLLGRWIASAATHRRVIEVKANTE